MDGTIVYVLVIVLIALTFDFINGFHDSANSIATVVGTRVLKPLPAVIWAAFFNFVALFTVGTAVAKAIGKGMIDLDVVTPTVILGGLSGAIIWNLITWFYGLPSSSSHALIGGYAGSAVAAAGMGAIEWGTKWMQTLAFIVLSPLIGMFLGFTLMVLVSWMFHRVPRGPADRFFRVAQLGSSALFSLSHGANDAQKTMGIIVSLLVSVNHVFATQTGWLHNLYVPNADHIPFWVELCAYSALSLGTLFGGWRIVHTMGTRITRLRPVGGFCAETGGAAAIFFA
ncbi:MAG TPA: inorganic phosphate transporter, partial [Pseudonocardiaceae bacterium]|nr:inorganic phosphate transporter [Pseudonocardiaceae bacterium]